jgi:hypothetical protein
MKKALPCMLILISLYSCSSTNLVFISVLKPAPVTMSPDIKNIGIINRSTVKDRNRAIDMVDKVLSIEGDSLDSQAAKQETIGLADELVKNSKFSNVTVFNNVDLRTEVPGQFPAPLGWDQVDQICKDKNIDALFTLELFDTDSKVNYAAIPITIKTPLGNIPGIEHQATMLTNVKSGWRIYDPTQRLILDEYSLNRELTLSGRGINPVAAVGAIMNRKEALKDLSNKMGHDYAFRLIPYWIRVSRDYYVKGTENFKIGKRKAQTGNWQGAGELWKKETNSSSSKIAGRACYNMAIICEINGQLDLAIEWAQKSYENYGNRLALQYVNILKHRKDSENVLKFQQRN